MKTTAALTTAFLLLSGLEPVAQTTTLMTDDSPTGL